MNRPLRFKDIPEHERALSEQFRLAGEQWADADGAARLMEELKTSALETRKSNLILERGDMPDNKAERIIKSSPAWEEYIRQMVTLRTDANKHKVTMEFIRLKYGEEQRRDANFRTEARLSRG